MDYLYLGKIVDTHGIKGEIRILLNDFFIYHYTLFLCYMTFVIIITLVII